MEKILISACLLGQRVRYDGAGAKSASEILVRWEREGRLVAVCPEVAGGLPVPRPAAELRGGGGDLVLLGRAKVETRAGDDVTDAFRAGAEEALRLARRHGIRIAVLKERSPSCGSSEIYDGSFSRKRIPGVGVTAALLRQEGILVFNEDEFAEADISARALRR